MNFIKKFFLNYDCMMGGAIISINHIIIDILSNYFIIVDNIYQKITIIFCLDRPIENLKMWLLERKVACCRFNGEAEQRLPSGANKKCDAVGEINFLPHMR